MDADPTVTSDPCESCVCPQSVPGAQQSGSERGAAAAEQNRVLENPAVMWRNPAVRSVQGDPVLFSLPAGTRTCWSRTGLPEPVDGLICPVSHPVLESSASYFQSSSEQMGSVRARLVLYQSGSGPIWFRTNLVLDQSGSVLTVHAVGNRTSDSVLSSVPSWTFRV